MRVVLANGAEVLFRSGDQADRLRGPNLSWVWLDEAAQCKKAVWDVLIGRLRAEGQAGRAWMTTTPKGMNWVYDLTVSGSPDVAAFHVTTADNPYLSREFVDAVAAQYTGTFAAQELGGQFVMAEGLVYENFSPEVWPLGNLAPADMEPDVDKGIELGFDDGYIDPRAILFIQRLEDGSVFVFDELYHTRHLEETCVGEVVQRCEDREWPLPDIACGSHEAKALQVHFRKANIPARFRNHKIVEGIPIVRSLICDGKGRRSLIIHPRCVNLLAEITSGYRYPEGGRGGAHEKPADGNDHACDALRYWCYIRRRR
jgi:PBSX family phage terminase large subunit